MCLVRKRMNTDGTKLYYQILQNSDQSDLQTMIFIWQYVKTFETIES